MRAVGCDRCKKLAAAPLGFLEGWTALASNGKRPDDPQGLNKSEMQLCKECSESFEKWYLLRSG